MYYDRTSQNFKDVSNKEHVLYISRHKPEQTNKAVFFFLEIQLTFIISAKEIRFSPVSVCGLVGLSAGLYRNY